MSYLPGVFFPYQRVDTAWKWLEYLIDAPDRNYPEISYTIISHTVEGLLGLEPDAPEHAVATIPRLPASIADLTVRDIPLGDHRIDVGHMGVLEVGRHPSLWQPAPHLEGAIRGRASHAPRRWRNAPGRATPAPRRHPERSGALLRQEGRPRWSADEPARMRCTAPLIGSPAHAWPTRKEQGEDALARDFWPRFDGIAIKQPAPCGRTASRRTVGGSDRARPTL